MKLRLNGRNIKLKPYEWEALKLPFQKAIFKSILKELAEKTFTVRCISSWFKWSHHSEYPESRVFLDLLTKREPFRRGVKKFNQQVDVDWIANEKTDKLGVFIYKLTTHLKEEGVLEEIREPILENHILKPLVICPSFIENSQIKRGYLSNLFEYAQKTDSYFPSLRDIRNYFRTTNENIRKIGESWEKLKRLYKHWQETGEISLVIPEYLKGDYHLIKEIHK